MSGELTPTHSPQGAAASFIEQVKQAQPALAPVAHPWLACFRAEGMERFAKAGLPTTRNEAWKFTSLRGLDKLALSPAPDARSVPVDAIPTALEAACPRLVFIGGQFRADLSRTQGLPDGVLLDALSVQMATDPQGLADRMEGLLARFPGADHPMRALNAAFLADGALLHVPAGVKLAQPVELVFLAPPGAAAAWHPRLLVVVEDGAEATIVEHHAGQPGAAYLSNIAADVAVGKGARLHHYKIQREGTDAFHIATLNTHLAEGSTYDTFVLNLGARLARHEARQVLDGEKIEARVSGAYAIGGDQVSDITTLIDHAKPNCTSREVVKGVIDGKARGVFQGKIIVRPDAQKTDGYQLNRALLLSETSEINSKPELEIYADDVKCSHGATAGELDEDQMFYLRARGVPRDMARVMLIGAFLDEAMDEIIDEQVRTYFRAAAAAWMGTERA